MENISFPHHSKLDDRKIEEKKEKIQKKKQKSKWNELRLKGSEVRTETDLKSNILEIKKKINREKEMVCQTLPGSKLVKTKKR